MNLLNDPMAAGFIWRVVLLIFSWSMFLQLKKEGASQFWWIKMLKSARVVSMENYNYAGMVEKSRLTFRWLSIAATVIILVHSFQFYRRYDPDFLFGPKPVTFNSPNEKPALPPAVPGAGGGGAVTPGHAGAPQPGAPGRPGASGQPGGYSQPSQPGTPGGNAAPGGPGGLPAPGGGGSRGMPGTR